MPSPGQIYYATSLAGSFRLMGVVESLEISGDIPYELAENLSVIDPQGFTRLFVNVMSPRHEASLRIRYVRPQGEPFARMVEKAATMHRDIVYSRHSLTDHVYLQVVLDGVNCLRLSGYPSRYSWRIDAGQVNVLAIDMTMILAHKDWYRSLDIAQCINLQESW